MKKYHQIILNRGSEKDCFKFEILSSSINFLFVYLAIELNLNALVLFLFGACSLSYILLKAVKKKEIYEVSEETFEQVEEMIGE